MGRTLRSKLIITFISITLFSITFFGLLLFNLVQNYLVKQLQFNLTEQVTVTRHVLESNWDKGIERLSTSLKMDKQNYTRLTIIDASGKVLVDSNADPKLMPNHKNRPEFMSALHGQIGKSIHFSKTIKRKMLYIAQPIKQNGQIVGAVRLSLPLDILNHSLLNVLSFLLGAVFLTLLISVFLALYLAKNISTPILKMVDMAQSISLGNYEAKVKIKDSSDEINILGKTLNIMSSKLKDGLEEIQEERNKFETILYKLQDSIIVLDQGRKIQFINPSTEKSFHVSLSDIKGKSYLGLFRHREVAETVEKVFAIGEDAKVSLEFSGLQKHYLDVFITLTGKDVQQMMIILIRDMTKIHQLEQVRKEFVANVSHELKTPLTSILGFTETLLEEKVDDIKIRNRFLQIIQDEAHRLLRLVNDLLSLSKLEGNNPVDFLQQELGDIAERINLVLKRFTTQADNASIQLSFENFCPNLPPIYYDIDGLEQILINLIDNAIKYTKKGGSVRVTLEDQGENIKISVIDTGLGIPDEDLGRIFERFYRVDKARSRQLGGTGLGLSIVKHLVEAHKGQLSVESEVGQGTNFSFTLPKNKII